jgi:gamma-glutamyltranspeptidase/glutathione hydrolase
MTSSVEAAFGSRIMVHGFLLNNQLTDFSFRPEVDGKPVANRVEAGKRPLSSMAPTILYDKAGHVAAILGSPGGSQIINYVAKTMSGAAGLESHACGGGGAAAFRQPQRPDGT